MLKKILAEEYEYTRFFRDYELIAKIKRSMDNLTEVPPFLGGDYEK